MVSYGLEYSVCHTGPPNPLDRLQLWAVSAHEAQVSWVVPFDGNDLIVMHRIIVWSNDVNMHLWAHISTFMLLQH